MLRGGYALVLQRLEAGLIVGSGTIVVLIDCPLTIALEWVVEAEGAVDWKLVVVHTEAVTLGVWIAEEASLKDRIGGRLNTGNVVARTESGLFNLGKVVLRLFTKVSIRYNESYY